MVPCSQARHWMVPTSQVPTLSVAMFDSIDFSKVDLSDTKIAKSLKSVDISLKDILGSHAKWVKTNGKEGRRAIFSKNDMSNQNLSGVNLSAADFSLANMKGADLSKSECLMADFSLLRFTRVCFYTR